MHETSQLYQIIESYWDRRQNQEGVARLSVQIATALGRIHNGFSAKRFGV